MSSWAAALRIARRDAWRAKGRSLLVVAMIGLPVFGVTAIDVVARTAELSPAEGAARDFGAADAVLTDGGTTSLDQFDSSGASGSPRPPGTPVDLTAGLPAGSRWVPDHSVQDRASAGDRATSVNIRDLSYDDPLVAGVYSQQAGRPPRAPGEVVLTTPLADRLGVAVGDDVGVGADGPSRQVVGLAASGSFYGELTALVAPGALPKSRQTATTQLFVDVPGVFDASVVRAVNAHGVLVRPRAEPVPGAPPSLTEQIPTQARDVASVTLVVGMALLEVVLLAGPAFAVGARRSRHQLALLAVTGAERRDVRRTVLAGGIVLGGVGASLGLLAGVGCALAALPYSSHVVGQVLGPLDLRPVELGGIALVGMLTAVLAALLPARTAARQDVVAALTGRRGTVRTSARVPVLGLLAAVAGGLLALEGARRRDTLIVLVGSAVAELGLVATTPAVVGLVGRLGPLLPAAPRLALRDAARHRGRPLRPSPRCWRPSWARPRSARTSPACSSTSPGSTSRRRCPAPLSSVCTTRWSDAPYRPAHRPCAPHCRCNRWSRWARWTVRTPPATPRPSPHPRSAVRSRGSRRPRPRPLPRPRRPTRGAPGPGRRRSATCRATSWAAPTYCAGSRGRRTRRCCASSPPAKSWCPVRGCSTSVAGPPWSCTGSGASTTPTPADPAARCGPAPPTRGRPPSSRPRRPPAPAWSRPPAVWWPSSPARSATSSRTPPRARWHRPASTAACT